jgi:NAD(P)-dependent dehydrogenase (short-subunit alcohol dehydrogenase family)
MVFFSGAAGVRKLLPNHTAIGATNGAVEAFARQLAREIAPTARQRHRRRPGAHAHLRRPDAAEAARGMYADYAETALVGRVGEPEDIARAAIYLMGSGAT